MTIVYEATVLKAGKVIDSFTAIDEGDFIRQVRYLEKTLGDEYTIEVTSNTVNGNIDIYSKITGDTSNEQEQMDDDGGAVRSANVEPWHYPYENNFKWQVNENLPDGTED